MYIFSLFYFFQKVLLDKCALVLGLYGRNLCRGSLKSEFGKINHSEIILSQQWTDFSQIFLCFSLLNNTYCQKNHMQVDLVGNFLTIKPLKKIILNNMQYHWLFILIYCGFCSQSSRNLDLQSRLEEQTDENEHLQNTLETLRKTNAEQVKKIDQYIEKLHEVRPQRFIIENVWN